MEDLVGPVADGALPDLARAPTPELGDAEGPQLADLGGADDPWPDDLAGQDDGALPDLGSGPVGEVDLADLGLVRARSVSSDVPARSGRRRTGRRSRRPAAPREDASAQNDRDGTPDEPPRPQDDPAPAPERAAGPLVGPAAQDADAGAERLFGPDGVLDPSAPPEGREAKRAPRTAEERLQHALKLAYRHLSKRDRTVSEVRAHLEKRDVDEASIAAALAELVEFRYLDDERYAARYVEDKRRLEGWGHLRIEQGLRRTGVPRELADRAVADDPLRAEEADLAVETLDQRLGGRPPGDDRGRQKALRMLATKGYPLDTAYAAVRAYERRCAAREDG